MLTAPHTLAGAFHADLLKSFQEPYKVGAVTVPILQIRKLRLRVMKAPALVPMLLNDSWDLNPNV